MKLIDFRQNKTSELVCKEYWAFNVLGIYDKSKDYTELNTCLDEYTNQKQNNISIKTIK